MASVNPTADSSEFTEVPSEQTVEHKDLANAIRALAMDAVQKANSGHPGMPMGMADVATVLFTRYLKFDPSDPSWPDRDRFVLSAGHGSMLLYALLHLTGYEAMTMDEIRNFRQLGSITAGHPEYGHVPGVEMTTGPLGQGIATAVGMALAERIMAAKFGSELVDHRTWVIASDGDLMEGISHEAASFAGHMKLDRLVVLYDDNGISIDGDTGLAWSDDVLARFAAYGWDTSSADGHDPEAVAAAIEAAQKTDRPSLIACRTTIARGAPTKAGTAGSHGAPLGDEEIAATREAIGWDAPPFEIPEPVLAAWRQAGTRSEFERAAWKKRLGETDATVRSEFERLMAGDLPEGWKQAVSAFRTQLVADRPVRATRESSGAVLEALTAAVPEMVGGSADLTGSNNTYVKNMAAVAAGAYGGRYIHYGIREHGMAAAMNGMALHGGVIPYSGTFLIFSDYLRPSLRLAALMGKRVVHVLTHDSIGLGEDGPTHQPVEHLASLRAMPNLYVFRPADAVETAECWEAALDAADTPSAMALTRQKVPALRTEDSADNLSVRGAYVLAAAEGTAQVTLLATGSEVAIAMEARDLLAKDGIAATVVSMPCWELFEKQSDSYRRAVLGENTVRVAVEAGVKLGWERYIGTEGGFVGMDSFGASAPAPALYEHFNITAQHVADEAKARL